MVNFYITSLFKIRKLLRLLKPMYEGQGLLGRKNVTISGTMGLNRAGNKIDLKSFSSLSILHAYNSY